MRQPSEPNPSGEPASLLSRVLLFLMGLAACVIVPVAAVDMYFAAAPELQPIAFAVGVCLSISAISIGSFLIVLAFRE